MTSMKNALAAVGAITIIAVAGLAIGFGAFSGNPSDDSDAASSSDIVKDLNKYADMLNDTSTNYSLYLNNAIFTTANSNGYHVYTQPIKGTVKVEGLNLSFDVWYSEQYNQKYHWVIPYHAIDGIRSPLITA